MKNYEIMFILSTQLTDEEHYRINIKIHDSKK